MLYNRSVIRLLDTVKTSSEYLEDAGIEDAFADAEILALHAAGIDRLAAYMENPEISKELLAKIRRVIRRRAKGEPVQYIVGHVEFLGLKIHVGKGVLIPRPETELLAEEAMRMMHGAGRKLQGANAINQQPSTIRRVKILDLCTGSGCIALALARGLSDADVYGTDVSKDALRYAKKNARDNGVKGVTFLEGSLFAPVKRGFRFDLIVSNPPYVRKSDIEGLQREIKEWEPLDALDGGEDGLDFYRMIFSEAPEYLFQDGKIILELGFGQAEEVEKIARRAGFTHLETKKDYAGIDRIFKAKR
jgi:release factor glutamine methyltransferase